MVFVDILDEHLEEAEFLWHLRSDALTDRSYNLGRLSEIEERLVAHLDGLLLGEKEAWKLLEPKLADGDRGQAFAAASVALESENDGVAALVCDQLDTASRSTRAGIQDAFCHASHARMEPMLRKLLQSNRLSDRSLAIDSLSFRRAPMDQNDLRAFLRDSSIEMVRAALLAIARHKITLLEKDIMPLLRSDNIALRQEAIRTSLMLGIDSAVNEARQIVHKFSDQAGEMLVLLGNAGQIKDLPLLIDAVREPALGRDAITALGLLGYSGAMPCLLKSVGDPKLARLAGEAIHVITGVDLEKGGMTAVDHSARQQDDDDELEEDLDDGLACPDPQAIYAWWQEKASTFASGVRYRFGKPYGTAVLLDGLKHANLRHRHHAAFELALLAPTFPYIETRALARVQLMQLASLNPA